jgi:hypothetical protein
MIANGSEHSAEYQLTGCRSREDMRILRNYVQLPRGPVLVRQRDAGPCNVGGSSAAPR